jgi:hypothetical protein
MLLSGCRTMPGVTRGWRRRRQKLPRSCRTLWTRQTRGSRRQRPGMQTRPATTWRGLAAAAGVSVSLHLV